MLTYLILSYRRYYKCCRRCGKPGRSDLLAKNHIPECQPSLPEGETGFLLVYELPEIELEQFKMNMRIIGEPAQFVYDEPPSISQGIDAVVQHTNARKVTAKDVTPGQLGLEPKEANDTVSELSLIHI